MASKFLTNENIKILFDVLLDEPAIKMSSPHTIEEVKKIISMNVKPYYEREKMHNPNLVELNKGFLTSILTHINKIGILQQHQQLQQQQPYKLEDIQKQKQTRFDSDLSKMRMEFESSMQPPKPKEINFANGLSESKITNMDQLLADALSKRNYDVDQLQKNNYLNPNNSSSLLKPMDTSIKVEKQKEYERVLQNQEFFKTIKIGESDIPNPTNEFIDLQTQTNVSNLNSNPTFLSRLKKVDDNVDILQRLKTLEDKVDTVLTKVLELLSIQNK